VSVRIETIDLKIFTFVTPCCVDVMERPCRSPRTAKYSLYPNCKKSLFAKSDCSSGNVTGVRGLARVTATGFNSRAVSIHGEVNEFCREAFQ
jgi:hypothetical protein